MDLGLAGKRALVFGASRGLGHAVAAALAAEGARVAIAARPSDRLEGARVRCGAEVAVAVDLDQPGAAGGAVRAVTAQWGGLDILVTNTGGPAKATFEQLDRGGWQHGFESLWLSATDAIAAALPGMRAQGWGRVLLVTSVAAREPMPGLTVSNGLRAGLLALAKDLARDVAKDGVTVNALLPGYTRTERMDELGVTDALVAAQVPAGRMGTPAEFAAVAAFLASVHASYVTGQAVAVDGGWLRSI
ncbi:MAG: SDR family oxidoreductase [Myxococcales bacterium]|nr:SDR family oxidoreductase [Myxococcales bacterium]